MSIPQKTIQDLELGSVLKEVASFCVSSLGNKQTLKIVPFCDRKKLLEELAYTNEYLTSFESDNRIPNHHFDDIQEFIKQLGIENSYLEPDHFLKIKAVCETIKEQKKYFKKFASYYPSLFNLSEEVEFIPLIVNEIKKIVSPYGEIENSSSTALKNIRRTISSVQGKIGQSFSSALRNAKASGYLDPINESVIDNHRVLAVLAMHRKKVNGSLLGSSKSGGIVYIAPQATLSYQRELQNLIYEEKEEIIRILKTLSGQIRPFTEQLSSCMVYLTHLDVISAKAKYAHVINALLPTIVKEKKIFFKDAYHPILWLKNSEAKVPVIPQTVKLTKEQQIIIISGPNAGGKSITLKTMGLLQLMLQCGLLIPVNRQSETCIFDTILTDIGDNQSIENQLSTYSYRLKNMRHFLRKCHQDTLFLIDEFGTGSDPELGGALAEIFLEEFYDKKAFGVITTHYSNLKVLANELKNATNASMQFDEKTFEPLYKLDIGQAGSSFTFEVALKNGIPYRMINKAKKRVKKEKIRLDTTITKLQKERNRLQKSSDTMEKQRTEGRARIQSLQEKEKKIQEKLAGFQTLYDSNQKMLSLGRKTNELFNKYFQTNNKKELFTALNKWIVDEKIKYEKKKPAKRQTKSGEKKERKRAKLKQKVIQETEREVLKEMEEIRKEQKVIAEKTLKTNITAVFEVGDGVRLIDGQSVGVIEKMEKGNVFVNYGVFTTQTTAEKLELVEKKK